MSTTLPAKPLTATQQRNAQDLLRTDYYKLTQAVNTRITDETNAKVKAAKEAWLVANPDAQTLADEYAKFITKVDKRLKRFNKQAREAGFYEPCRVNSRGVVSNLYVSGLARDIEVNSADLQKEIDKIRREGELLARKARTASDDLFATKEREILLATLGDVGTLLTLPTVDEFFAAL